MKIIDYRNNKDIDVYFTEYKWIFKNTSYQKFKNGGIKCPYETRYEDRGYIGEGEYKPCIKNDHTREYDDWKHMLKRVYNEEFHNKYPTYKDCRLYEDWHNFQIFAKWSNENYYEVPNQRMCLDKDILIKGNKLYSPDTCIYVPERINCLLLKCDSHRGKYPIGVTYHKKTSSFNTNLSIITDGKRKRINLGYYQTPVEAYEVYKRAKENYIKQVADEYRSYIPNELYQALYKYEVNIND